MEKSPPRNKSIGTRVSEEEYAALGELAAARGLNLGEWLRELVLSELIARPAEQVMVAEVLALRTILLNALCVIANGQPIPDQEMRQLIARADAEKARKAKERLAQALRAM
jgi:hypothetical protein